MNIVGIDLGSSNIVLQQMTQKGPDIILSESSFRSLPTIVSFSDSQRFVCNEVATNKLKTNFRNTIQYPQRLTREYDEKYLTVETQNDEFQVEFFGQVSLKIVQILAMIFNYLKKTIERCLQNFKAVISYPDHFTESEKQMY